MPLVSNSLSPAQLLPRRWVARESRNKAEQPWEYARKGGTLGVKRRNRIGFVPPFYGFLRLFTAIGLEKSAVQWNARPQSFRTGTSLPLEKETDDNALETDCT